VRVDVACRKCGQQQRVDVGAPAAGQSIEDYVHLVQERLMHRPSFECFGGHMELAPPVPRFWDVRWETLGD
jgi:hypothetical protein